MGLIKKLDYLRNQLKTSLKMRKRSTKTDNEYKKSGTHLFKKKTLIGFLLIFSLVAFLLHLPFLSERAAPLVNSSSSNFSNVADMLYTYGVGLLLIVVGIAFFSIPGVGILTLLIGLSVIYHALKKR